MLPTRQYITPTFSKIAHPIHLLGLLSLHPAFTAHNLFTQHTQSGSDPFYPVCLTYKLLLLHPTCFIGSQPVRNTRVQAMVFCTQPAQIKASHLANLEEEDEDEVDQDNDDEDNKAFCSENRTFNLDDEPKDVRLDRFHLRMGNILRFLMGKREKAVSGDFDPDDKWFCDEFVQPLGKQSVEEIMGIFNDIIPESTRAILGCATLTPEHIMALPSIDHSASDPGVYLICFEKASDLEFEAADVQFTGLNKQDHKVPSGLYTGSSIKSVSGRCVNHGALFKKISTKNLIYGRYLESGTKVMYLYCHANLHELVPVYRQVGVFSQQLENIDLLPTDVQWLVRLLEQVMILLLDVYEPCKDPKLRKTVGYSDRMYKKVLEECGVPLSVFHPLNHAMPLKQTTGNARSIHPRMPGRLTWQEYQGKDLGDEPFSKTKLLLTYLRRVHGVDLRNDKIIADKMMGDLELDDMDTDDE
ncbi:hypothetical protein N7505_011537 [Penicillium chrysogenum]|uniref:Uncharacterized protein n=2 Tax=Penicillium chrysogenum TaxID=5076 RepID=A0ABQ8W721_PENCH|nr:hypothetical protein N7505_011537 [Penicillium chrysogenum]